MIIIHFIADEPSSCQGWGLWKLLLRTRSRGDYIPHTMMSQRGCLIVVKIGDWGIMATCTQYKLYPLRITTGNFPTMSPKDEDQPSGSQPMPMSTPRFTAAPPGLLAHRTPNPPRYLLILTQNHKRRSPINNGQTEVNEGDGAKSIVLPASLRRSWGHMKTKTIGPELNSRPRGGCSLIALGFGTDRVHPRLCPDPLLLQRKSLRFFPRYRKIWDILSFGMQPQTASARRSGAILGSEPSRIPWIADISFS